MRFLRQEYIVTTISDRSFSDTDTIKHVLSALKKENINFTLSTRKPSEWGHSNLSLNYEEVRVKEVKEDSVDFIIFNRSSITNLTNIPFDSIIEILAITKKNNILEQDKNPDRWGLMDIEEKEE